MTKGMEAIKLRAYQTIAIRQCFDAWRDGARSVILAIATGAGKRLLALWIMELAAKAGRKVLFVGNRRLLINQAVNDSEKYRIPYGVIMADCLEGDFGATNQIASLQTLESRHFYEKWTGEATGPGLPEANLIVIDEIHGHTAKYQQLLSFYPNAKVLGLTATPAGPEGRSLVPRPYDVLLEPIKNSELIAQEHLLPTTVFAPSEPNLQGVHVSNGQEYNQAQLGRKVRDCTLAADVFKEWEPFRDRATVCFVPGIPFGRSLVEQFNQRYGNGTAALIEAKTKPAEREAMFDSVKAGGPGHARVLVSCDVLREGFDLPLLSCGIDLQPNSQLRSYWQKLGRIKRPFGEQKQAIWLDLAGNYWRFPHPDEDPEWPIGGEETTQDLIEKRRKTTGDPAPIACPKCSLVRTGGAVCPGCGYQAAEYVRRIRMGHGKLQEVPAIERKAKELTAEQRLLNKWKSHLFRAMHSSLTFGQAAHLFARETGAGPQRGWPGTFEAHSMEWKRRPKHTLTPADIMQMFATYQDKP